MALLNVAKNVPETSIDNTTISIHGQPGIGKTEFADGMDDVLHLSLERRCDHVKGWKEDRSDWDGIEELVKGLKAHPCKAVSIDTYANLWSLREAKYCKDHNIKTLLEEKPYALGYAVCTTDIHNLLLRIMAVKRLILICHTTYTETPVPVPGGGEVMKVKWVPECANGGTGSPQARMSLVLQKISGLVLYMEMVGDKRVIHPNPSDKWIATVKTPIGSRKLSDSIVVPDGAIGYQVLKEALSATKVSG